MSRIGFLRRQAETCLRFAETCSDKTTAEYLRLMGAEFSSGPSRRRMTGFMPPVRRMQVQSGEPNNLRVGFRRATLRVIAAHGRVAAALPRLEARKPATRL